MRGVDRWTAFFVWVFFESVPLERFKAIMSGVKDSSEWVKRFLSSPECMQGLSSVVKIIHNHYWDRGGFDGYWSFEDSLHLAVQELLERVSNKLDMKRTLPEQLTISLMWVYQRLKRCLLREKMEQMRRFRPSSEEEKEIPEPSVDFKDPFLVPSFQKDLAFDGRRPSFTLALFGGNG